MAHKGYQGSSVSSPVGQFQSHQAHPLLLHSLCPTSGAQSVTLAFQRADPLLGLRTWQLPPRHPSVKAGGSPPVRTWQCSQGQEGRSALSRPYVLGTLGMPGEEAVATPKLPSLPYSPSY